LKPKLSNKKTFSSVWIIPLTALILGLWVVIYGLMTQGPTITISFQTAEGIEEGKTRVKLRDVEIGQVEDIALDPDSKGVIATIKLDRLATEFLREDTQFWVVRARIGSGGVSGISTILSGAYIEMEPGTGNEGQRKFTGLETPPLTPIGAPGIRLILISDGTTRVTTGDAVLYKGYQVGRVESSTFDHKAQHIRTIIFIDAPYHELVNSSVRFWDTSGVSVKAGAEGINIVAGSLQTILMGGIAFEGIEGLPPGQTVADESEFILYPDYQTISKNPYQNGLYIVAAFDQSLRGLVPGAPVEYRGINIGRVERILIKELVNLGLSSSGSPIPVLLYIEPGRMELPDSLESVEQIKNSIVKGVANGMRATLKTGNLLTGSLYVNIGYFPEEEVATVGRFNDYLTIPTIPSGLGQLEHKLANLLDKLNNLPLEKTVDGANSVLGNTNELLVKLDSLLANESSQALPGELAETLQELRKTAAGLSPGAPMYQSLNSSLTKLDQVLRNLESLSRTLADKPNSVLLPTQLPKDPVPEASR
jgi:paraquat-inducible protein B